MGNNQQNGKQQLSKMSKYLDWIFIGLTFALFLLLGSIVFFFFFSTLSVLAPTEEAANSVIHASYVIATVLSVFLGMLAIGATTRNQYPTVCAIVSAVGSACLVGRLITMYAAGSMLPYQAIALGCGAVLCLIGAWSFQKRGRFPF